MSDPSTQGVKTALHPPSDPAAAQAVYTALPGMPPKTGGDCHVGFDAAGRHIGLAPGGGPRGMTSPAAYRPVPDIEAKLAEVTTAGARVREPVHDVDDGRLVAAVADPDGNVLGLLPDRCVSDSRSRAPRGRDTGPRLACDADVRGARPPADGALHGAAFFWRAGQRCADRRSFDGDGEAAATAGRHDRRRRSDERPDARVGRRMVERRASPRPECRGGSPRPGVAPPRRLPRRSR